MQSEKSLIVSEQRKNEVLTSMNSLFVEYNEKLSGIKRIADFVDGKDDLVSYFTRNSVNTSIARKLFDFDSAKAVLDAEFWSNAIEKTDVLECMNADKRNEWHKMISEYKTPPFEKETVISTIGNLLLSRGTFFSEKVDGIFRKLSGKHVTNSPQGFRKRMIISYALDSFGYVSHSRAEYIHDLRSVVAKLLNRDEPKTYRTLSDIGNIVRAKAWGEWNDFDGGAFRLKLYKCGTAHMEIHPEVAVKLNLILSSLYPMAIASECKKVKKDERTVPLMKDILPYTVTEKLASLADHLSRHDSVFFYKNEDMDKVTFKKVKEILSFLDGECKDRVWSFNYNVYPILVKIIRTGYLPEKVSHQFYPTSPELAQRAVDLADISSEDQILEPSAGHGGIASFLPKERVTCVEVNDLNCDILKQKGFNVINDDFLKWETQDRFSKIVMNPPFANGEAERHLRKAVDLLSGKGTLVAVLPSIFKNKEVIEGMNHEWSEIIKEGTVNVVLLKMTHK